MKFFANFLPGVGPALTALMNPWILLGGVLLLVGAFFYGLHVGNERLESYQQAVKKVGEAQEEKVAFFKQRRAEKTKEVESDYANWVVDLKRDRDAALARVRALASRSVLPTISEAARGGNQSSAGIVCFDQRKFDAAVGNFIRAELESTPPILDRGDSATAVAKLCSIWSVGQWTLDPASKGK